jgi:hypothetical protein
MSTKHWVPEIAYEEAEDGLTSHIPFISVPKDEDMPKILFLFESRETGEFEFGPEGDPLPIVEMDLHQYADMIYLKKGLPADLFDKVRVCLGLEPLSTAAQKGAKISEKVRKNVSEK